MGELYFLFAIIAVLIFAAIVAFSFWQQKLRGQRRSSAKQEYVDPLFAELEGQKKTAKGKIKAGLAKVGLDGAAKSPSPNKSDANTSAGAADGADDSTVSEQAAQPGAAPATSSAKRTVPIVASSTNKTGGKKAPAFDAKSEGGSKTKAKKPSDSKASSGSPANNPTSSPANVLSDSPSVSAKSTASSSSESPVLGTPKVDAGSSIVTELVARVKNPEPIEQKELLTLFRDYDFKFHRKVHIYGLNQLTEMWRDIEFELPSARYTELGVAIQLADREGAMSKKELHDFQQMALEFSNKFDAPFEFSLDIDEALDQAQILDQIGRRYDAMAVLNVVPRSKSGFRMADIESCARDLMMSTDKNGIYVKTKGQKQNLSVLYRLACTDGSGHFGITTGAMTPVFDLVIYMNVPATGEPDRVFQDMVKDANNLATWLDGKVVDRNGKVMTQRSYSILMQQLSDITFSMQQDGLVPGDTVSKKLF